MNKLEKQNSGLSRRDLLRKHGGKTGDELKAEDIDNPDYQSKPE